MHLESIFACLPRRSPVWKIMKGRFLLCSHYQGTTVSLMTPLAFVCTLCGHYRPFMNERLSFLGLQCNARSSLLSARHHFSILDALVFMLWCQARSGLGFLTWTSYALNFFQFWESTCQCSGGKGAAWDTRGLYRAVDSLLNWSVCLNTFPDSSLKTFPVPLNSESIQNISILVKLQVRGTQHHPNAWKALAGASHQIKVLCPEFCMPEVQRQDDI